jgi:hypothetical protein
VEHRTVSFGRVCFLGDLLLRVCFCEGGSKQHPKTTAWNLGGSHLGGCVSGGSFVRGSVSAGVVKVHPRHHNVEQLVLWLAPDGRSKLNPNLTRIRVKTYFPVYGLYEISLDFVCSVIQRTKSRVKLLCFDFGFLLSLVSPLSGLHRAVRVRYVCLLPRPAQLVANLLPDEVVLTKSQASSE